MSNIRSYLKEKEKRKETNIENSKKIETPDFNTKIVKYKLSMFYRILLAIILIAAIVALIFFQQTNKVYTQMQVTNVISRQTISGTTDIMLGNHIVTYSRDGIQCMDVKGTAIWNQTFEMQNPMISTAKEIIAIADYNGRTVYIMNSQKKLGEVTLSMPIRNICVAANGVVMVVVEESKVTKIYMFDSQGNQLTDFSTRMNDTGYPTALGISDSARLVSVAYTYIELGEIKTRVAFYNFGAVGENYVDHLVSGYNYTDTIVPYMKFMNDETLFAVADNRLMIYSGSEVPEMKAEMLLDEEVQGVYSNEKYIGLIFMNSSGQGNYKLRVFDTSGKEMMNVPIDLEGMNDVNIFFQEDQVVIYNETNCIIYSLKGTLKYSGEFNKTVRVMLPGKSKTKYTVVTQEGIDILELK